MIHPTPFCIRGVCVVGDVRAFDRWFGQGQAWRGRGWVQCRCRPGRFQPAGQTDWRIVLGCARQWVHTVEVPVALAVAVGVLGSALLSNHCGCALLEVVVAVSVGVKLVL